MTRKGAKTREKERRSGRKSANECLYIDVLMCVRISGCSDIFEIDSSKTILPICIVCSLTSSSSWHTFWILWMIMAWVSVFLIPYLLFCNLSPLALSFAISSVVAIASPHLINNNNNNKLFGKHSTMPTWISLVSCLSIVNNFWIMRPKFDNKRPPLENIASYIFKALKWIKIIRCMKKNINNNRTKKSETCSTHKL